MHTNSQITIGYILANRLCFYVSNRNESFASGNLKIHNRKRTHTKNESRENKAQTDTHTQHSSISKENANAIKSQKFTTIIIIFDSNGDALLSTRTTKRKTKKEEERKLNSVEHFHFRSVVQTEDFIAMFSVWCFFS